MLATRGCPVGVLILKLHYLQSPFSLQLSIYFLIVEVVCTQDSGSLKAPLDPDATSDKHTSKLPPFFFKERKAGPGPEKISIFISSEKTFPLEISATTCEDLTF